MQTGCLKFKSFQSPLRKHLRTKVAPDFHLAYSKTRIDVYETLCPQQMLVHKGGKSKNWGGECRDVTPTKLQSQNIFKESTGGGGGRVGGSGWM